MRYSRRAAMEIEHHDYIAQYRKKDTDSSSIYGCRVLKSENKTDKPPSDDRHSEVPRS